MKPTRQRAISNVEAFRALVDKTPALGRTKINLVTMLEYCEVLMSTETRIPVRYRRGGWRR